MTPDTVNAANAAAGQSETSPRVGRLIGYCTNVHAGATLDQTQANLQEHALAVKAIVAPDEPLHIGLWLSANAARELRAGDKLARFQGWLDEVGLRVFTINGFPYGDFHEPVVKHRVYQPTWAEPARLTYTLDLAHILTALLPEGEEGSISTLPIGWPLDASRRAEADALLAHAGKQLQQAVEELAKIESETGKLVHLNLEPEPGCILQRSEDVIAFFDQHVAAADQDDLARRHLRVCHDICHAAVMFEDQAEMFDRYKKAGIRIGKVQVSSAVRVRFESLDEPQRAAAIEQLRAFGEQRYLHQTVIRPAEKNATPLFYEDLPEALAAEAPRGEWRVHFHVPIFLGEFDHLESTRDKIVRCLWLLRDQTEVRHFEVETYAWEVLPESMRSEHLAEGIAREVLWLRERFEQPHANGNGANGEQS